RRGAPEPAPSLHAAAALGDSESGRGPAAGAAGAPPQPRPGRGRRGHGARRGAARSPRTGGGVGVAPVGLMLYTVRAECALGLELGFHNHDGELRPLEDGRSFLDRLLELLLFLELDLGWAWWAGVDPIELLERTRGRVPLVHVKDFRARGERSFCPIGDGGVGYERVAPAAVDAGVEWLLVEQDEADGSTLEAARRSL